jgi:peptide-methionine (R)-S-oxide reductase
LWEACIAASRAGAHAVPDPQKADRMTRRIPAAPPIAPMPASSHAPANPARRRLLGGSVLGLAGLALACSRTGQAAGGAASAKGPAAQGPVLVTVVEFRNDGTRVGKVRVPKVVRDDAEWKRLLTPKSYAVARRGGTESPFSGEYNALHDVRGVFRCICCGTALFDGRTKFDSGTGWPSFWQPIAAENIRAIEDRAFGMLRTETRCTRCDAHLGHVFEDGPRPTGLRYCMNSVALKLTRA